MPPAGCEANKPIPDCEKLNLLRCEKINKTKLFVRPYSSIKILTAGLKHFKVVNHQLFMDFVP